MNPMWPVIMSDLGGYRVCSKRAGLPFKDAVRVNEQGKCAKKGFKRCNKNSKPENAICVKKDTVCPITSVKFANDLDELHDLLQEPQYKILDVRGFKFPAGVKAVKVRGAKVWMIDGKK